MAGSPGPDFGYDASHAPRELTALYSDGKFTGTPGYTNFSGWQLEQMVETLATLKDGYYTAAASQWRQISQRLTSLHANLTGAGGTLLPRWDPTVSVASSVFFEMVGASTWSMNEWITVAAYNAATLERMAQDLVTARNQMKTIYQNFQSEWNTNMGKANYYTTAAGQASLMKLATQEAGAGGIPDVSTKDWQKPYLQAANAARTKYTAQAAKVMTTLGGSFRDNASALSEGNPFQGPTQAVNPIAALGAKVRGAAGSGLPGGGSATRQLAAQQRALEQRQAAARQQLAVQQRAARHQLAAQEKATQQHEVQERQAAQQRLATQERLATQQQIVAQQRTAAQRQLAAQRLAAQRQLAAQQLAAGQRQLLAQPLLAQERRAAQRQIEAQQQLAAERESAAQQLTGQRQAAEQQISGQQQLAGQEEAAARQQVVGGLGAGPLAGRFGGIGGPGGSSALRSAGGLGSALTPEQLLAAGGGGAPGMGGMPGGAAGSLLNNAARLAGRSAADEEALAGRRTSPLGQETLGQEPLSGRRGRDGAAPAGREARSLAEFREDREDYVTEVPTAPQAPTGRLLADASANGPAGRSDGPALSGRSAGPPPQPGLQGGTGPGGSELSGRRRRIEERDLETDDGLLTGDDVRHHQPPGDLAGRHGVEAIDLDTAAAALAAGHALGADRDAGTPIAPPTRSAAARVGEGRSAAAAAALAPAEVPDAGLEEEWVPTDAAAPAKRSEPGPAQNAQPSA